MITDSSPEIKLRKPVDQCIGMSITVFLVPISSPTLVRRHDFKNLQVL